MKLVEKLGEINFWGRSCGRVFCCFLMLMILLAWFGSSGGNRC